MKIIYLHDLNNQFDIDDRILNSSYIKNILSNNFIFCSKYIYFKISRISNFFKYIDSVIINNDNFSSIKNKKKAYYILDYDSFINMYHEKASEVIDISFFISKPKLEYVHANYQKFLLKKTIRNNYFSINVFSRMNKLQENKLLFSQNIYDDLTQKLISEIKLIKDHYDIAPNLTIFVLGNNAINDIFINSKIRYAELIGAKIDIISLDEKISDSDLISRINEANNDSSTHGIIVQLPLPKHIDKEKILNTIDPKKDVDCLSDINLKNLFRKNNIFYPCSVSAILELFKYYKIKLESKNITILGRSNLIGKSLFFALLNNDATVTICHSKTKKMSSITKTADILISTISKPNFLTKNFIKKNAIVIDVSTNYVDNQLIGDCNYHNVLTKTKFITPVPGSIGKLTVCFIFVNLIYLMTKEFI